MNSAPIELIQSWQSLTVLVIGDVMLDRYWHGRADRLCPEAPVPVVTVTAQRDYAGGAANVVANLVSLGARVIVLSVLGKDGSGDRLHQLLTQSDRVTDQLIRSPHRSTLTKQRVMAANHLLVRFDTGSTAAIAPTEEDEVIDRLTEWFPLCDAVVISDYDYGILTPRIIQVLTDLQASFPRPVVVDSKHLHRYRSLGATAVKPNYKQALALLGLPSQTDQRSTQITAHRAQLLEITGAAIVAVTLDWEGAVVFDRHALHLTSAIPAPSQQTSGAGDTYVSALTLALAARAPLALAASLAAAATAVVVQHAGTTCCTAEELLQHMNTRSPISHPHHPLPLP